MSKKNYEPVKDYERDLGWIILNDELFNSLLEDERRREVIRKHFIIKSSFEEIGGEMDRSYELVRQLYLTGLHKLKEKVLELIQARDHYNEIDKENARLTKEVVRLNLQLQAYSKETALKSVDTSLVNLEGISIRTLNALRSYDVNTIEDLVTRGRADILKFRNLGTKSVDELSDALSKYDVTLR